MSAAVAPTLTLAAVTLPDWMHGDPQLLALLALGIDEDAAYAACERRAIMDADKVTL